MGYLFKKMVKIVSWLCWCSGNRNLSVCVSLLLYACVLFLTLYWKRNSPLKRLKRSAVSRERLTEVALLSLTTMDIQLYNVYKHRAKAENRSPEGKDIHVNNDLFQ